MKILFTEEQRHFINRNFKRLGAKKDLKEDNKKLFRRIAAKCDEKSSDVIEVSGKEANLLYQFCIITQRTLSTAIAAYKKRGEAQYKNYIIKAEVTRDLLKELENKIKAKMNMEKK
jgi:hypothetical protein